MLVGVGSYAYFGRNAVYKAGVPATDEQQALNPLVDLKLPEGLENAIKHVFLFCNLDPLISYTEKLQDAEVTLTMHFRDLFLLAAMTTYNTMPTSWTGTGDTITGDFSKETNRTKNIWVQIHIHDNSDSGNHIDLLLDGGLITHYKLSGKKGAPVMEEVTIKFCEITVNTQPVNIDDGFDDAAFNITGNTEVSTIIAVAQASITDEKYFSIYGISAAYVKTLYHVWFDKAGDDTWTADPGTGTAIKCDISLDTTAQEVSDCITAAINAKADFGAANGGGTSTTITVTNTNNGNVIDIIDIDSGLIVATTTQGLLTQNGGFSNWDGGYASDACAMTVDCTVTWNTAAILGMGVQEWSIEVNVPHENLWVASSLTASENVPGVRDPPFIGRVTGFGTGNNAIAEWVKTKETKTQGTFKIQYGTTKYLQITTTVLKSIKGLGIPSAGKAIEGVTHEYEAVDAGAFSFSWTADETTDPESHINHTNI